MDGPSTSNGISLPEPTAKELLHYRPMMRSFHGRPTESVSAFIKNWLREVEIAGWSPRSMLLRFPTFLQGSARRWYDRTFGHLNLPVHDADANDQWKVILKSLIEEYDSAERRFNATNFLFNRKQAEGESLFDYLLALEKLAECCFDPSLIFRAAMRNMHPNLARVAENMQIHKFDTLLAKAHQIENNEAFYREHIQKTISDFYNESNNDNYENVYEEINESDSEDYFRERQINSNHVNGDYDEDYESDNYDDYDEEEYEINLKV